MINRLVPRKGSRILDIVTSYLIILFLIALSVLFSLLQPLYANFSNISNILTQTALLCIISIGLTYVMIVSEFDMSFAFLCSLGVNATVNLVQMKMPGALAVSIPLIIGLAIGLLNGFMVAELKVNSFIATFGLGTILTGVNFFISGGKTIVVVGGLPKWFLQFARGGVFGITTLTYIMVVVLVISLVIVRFTVFGRTLYAVGGNAAACKAVGINVKKYVYAAFLLSGFLAALTGVLLASRLGGGNPNAGDEFLLTSFAAVFLGMSMKNGYPNMLGTLLGALLISVIWNGITFIGLQYEYQLISTAIVILAFSMLSYGMKRRAIPRM